jgi:hypothetical protein
MVSVVARQLILCGSKEAVHSLVGKMKMELRGKGDINFGKS